MFKSDQPIKNAPEDLLSRAKFASTLAQTLLAYKDSAPLTIGLFGPWGSGKTSLVNLIINDIKKITESFPEERKTVIIPFNPWNFTSQDQLLQQYFKILADRFTDSKDSNLAKAGKILSEYGAGFESIPLIGKAVGKAAQLTGDEMQQHTLHGADVYKQRQDIIKYLEKQQCKIIITIDDIDRLTNDEIQLIFKLVSSVANFPNTIFLLSFDKDIVVNALRGFQGDDGNKYLEKIIQVAISVPPASQAQLQEVFAQYFDPLIDPDHTQFPNMVFDQQYWTDIAGHVFGMISNVRDIVRLYNSVLLKLDMIGDEVNFADIVMITLLELKQPKFYEWIRNHHMDLTQSLGYAVQSLSNGKKSKDQVKAQFLDEFKQFKPAISEEECDAILGIMFPVYGQATRTFGSHYINNDLVRAQRIGQADKFARYFILSIGDNKIPRKAVNEAVKNYSVEELEKFIQKSAVAHNSGDLITELDASLKELHKERKEILLKALIPSIKNLNDPLPSEGYYLSAKGRAEYLTIIIMNDLGNDTSFRIMLEAIEKAEVGDLEALSYMLDVMLISYDRIRPNKGFPQVVTEDNLDKLGKKYTQKSFELDKQHSLLSLPYSLSYFIIQYFNDGKDYEKYIKTKLSESDLNKLLYLSQTIDKWTGTSGVDYNDSQSEEREKFISNDEMMSVVEKAADSGLIKELDESQALKVAAFYFYHTREVIDKMIGIPENDCKQLLHDWKYYGDMDSEED